MQHLLARIKTTISRYESAHDELTVAEVEAHTRVLQVVAIALKQTDHYNVLQLVRELEEQEESFKRITDRQNDRNRELKNYNEKLQKSIKQRNETISSLNVVLKRQDQELGYLRPLAR